MRAVPKLEDGEVRQLHVGDQDAQHEDFHHRPGMHDLDESEQPPQAGHAPAEAHGNQDRQGCQNLGQRNGDRHREHQDGQGPKALIQELLARR